MSGVRIAVMENQFAFVIFVLLSSAAREEDMGSVELVWFVAFDMQAFVVTLAGW